MSDALGKKPELSEFDWPYFESSCRCTLTPDLRLEIAAITTDFVGEALTLSLAGTVDDVRAELIAIKHATELVRAQFQRPVTSLDSSCYARILFRHHIKDDLLPAPRYFPPDPVRLIGRLMASCSVACDKALMELDESHHGRSEGHGWKRWVRRLTALFASATLPTGARQDKPEASPFVAFVRELQKNLPAEFRRHTHSDAALAKAIGRARDENRDT